LWIPCPFKCVKYDIVRQSYLFNFYVHGTELYDFYALLSSTNPEFVKYVSIYIYHPDMMIWMELMTFKYWLSLSSFLYNYLTFYYVLYITMYFGPVAFMYKINDLSWVQLSIIILLDSIKILLIKTIFVRLCRFWIIKTNRRHICRTEAFFLHHVAVATDDGDVARRPGRNHRYHGSPYVQHRLPSTSDGR